MAAQQPDFQAVGGALATLAQELPLAQNMPVIGQAQQLQNQVTQLEALMLNRIAQLEALVLNCMQQLRDDIRDDIQQAQLYVDHKSIVRIFNSNVVTNDGHLLKMHLPNQQVPHALFPNTRNDIVHLTGNNLTALSAAYGFPLGAELTIKDKRNVFAQFIGSLPLP